MKEIQILNNGDTLNAIRTKINENFALTKEGIEGGVTDPLAKFGVNEGNETDGVADLLNIEEGTLSFKVGGEYPNLVVTSGDGVTTEIEHINPLHLQNLADGEYTVVVDGSNSNITDAEFYSQLLEPENVNDGDVWFNGESAKQYLTDAPSVTAVTPKTTINFKCMGNVGDLYIAAGGGQYFYISRDGGTTWESRVLPANVSGFLSCVVKDGYFYFATSTNSIMRTVEGEDPEVFHKFADTFYPQKIKVINDLFVLTASGPTLSTSSDGQTWNTITIGTEPIIDVFYINDLYYIISRNGTVYTSEDLITVTQKNKIEQSTYVQCAEIYKNTIIMGGISGSLYIYNLDTDEITLNNISSSEVILDMQVRPNGAMIFVGSNNMCKITYDFITYQNLYTSGGYLEHIYKDFIMGQAGSFLRINQTVQWFDYPWVPVGEVTISGGEVTYFTTYPYNTNGLHEASSSSFGLLRTAAVVDELNCHCEDAVLTPANLYNLNNYRTTNTEYQVGDKVGCPYHHNLQLTCIQAGTTSNEVLNTKGTLEAGDNIEDGTVIWEVEELGTGGGSAGQPIGLIYPLVCAKDYVPDGSLPTDGAEYSKAQFKGLWKDYLTSDEFTDYQSEWVITTPNTGQCVCLYYSNNMFIMLQNQGDIFTSTDGINWVNSYSHASSQRRVAYGNGKFIVVGAGFLCFSEDCMNWSSASHKLFGFTHTPQDLIFVNDKFFAVSDTTCYTFEDITMKGAVNFTSAEIGTKDYTCITYGNNKFVAGGTGLSTSEDGVNWTEEVVLTLDGRTFFWKQIIFAKNKFVALDEFGYVTSSEDGVNWTVPKQLSNISNTSSAPLAYGNNKFAIMCKDGIYISTDGENWTKETIPTSFAGTPCLTYAQDKFVWFDSSKTGYRFDYTKPKSLLNTCSYAEYEQDIIKYGQCAKFAIDVENEKFRVPLIKDGAVIQQALSNDELGKAYNAGSPDITGTFAVETSQWQSGAFAITGVSNSKGSTGGDGAHCEMGFKASDSNPIYSNSDTVQMNAVAMRYFVVVANGQINESMMDWSAWASSLQGKANTDGSNFNESVKNFDGQWQSKSVLLTNDMTKGTTVIDLSEYLPNDNYTYDIQLIVNGSCADVCILLLYSDLLVPHDLNSVGLRMSTNGRQASSYVRIPVDVRRKLYFYKSVACTSTDAYGVLALGYRRLGTNK